MQTHREWYDTFSHVVAKGLRIAIVI
jgi:hypothetical protein